jgi:hypothetical protein
VEVPNRTAQNPTNKRGRRKATNKDSPHLKKRKMVNACQQQIDETQCGLDTQPFPNVRIVVMSKNPRTMDTRNHNASLRVDELATNYIETGKTFDRKATIVDSYFSEQVADILNDLDPKSMVECRKRSDWNQWKEAIEKEIDSLYKREVFSEVMLTPTGTFLVGYKWFFVHKRNENGKIYKARLVAQGFTQKPDIDYNETYSPVTSGITFRYLVSLAVQNHLYL